MSTNEDSTVEILLHLDQQNADRGKHHQDQRASVANLLLVLTSGLIALLALDTNGAGERHVAPFLIIVGAFGAIWSAKQHERYALYERRAAYLKIALRRRLPSRRLRRMERLADRHTRRKYGFLNRLRVWYLWVGLYAIIGCLGIWLLVDSVRASPATDRGGVLQVRTDSSRE